MTELAEFSTKLNQCDLIVLTIVSTDRLYCRFFSIGQYKTRMYVADPLLIAELNQLSGEGEEINATGIAKLKQTYLTA